MHKTISALNTHEYFMQKALLQAKKALNNKEFPVGCVIVYENQIVATGKRSNSYKNITEFDHAEMIALKKLLSCSKKINFQKAIIYSTMEPCLMCFCTLLVNGIRNYVYSYEDVMGGGTNLPLQQLSPLYKNMKVAITKNILREKSLHLFKIFFNLAECNYLKDSLLSNYTLKQPLNIKYNNLYEK